MGGGAVPKIPDWRVYTVGEHTPELLKAQKMLNSMGLKVKITNKLYMHIVQCTYIY